MFTIASRLLPLILSAVLCAQSAQIERSGYRSALLGRDVEFIMVFPDAYQAQSKLGKRFPVLYLLHCAGCRADDWLSPEYGARVDMLIDSVGFIIAILDDGNRLGWWLDSPVLQNSNFSSLLAKEFKPRVDSIYATRPQKEFNGLAGHSMGGFGALHNLIEHPLLFGSAYSVKGAVDLLPYPSNWGLAAVLGSQEENKVQWQRANVLSQACRLKGRRISLAFYSGPNDWFFQDNRNLHRVLDSCGVPHQYFETDEQHFQVPFERMRSIMAYFDSVFTSHGSTPIKSRKPKTLPRSKPATGFRGETKLDLHGRQIPLSMPGEEREAAKVILFNFRYTSRLN